MLTLHTANRYEDLRDCLLDALTAQPVGDPFARQQIIVPSMAVKRDLQLAIARRRGVCTQVDFPFLAQWLWDCIGRLVEVPAVSPFAPQRLTWRLYRIFGDATWVAGQPRLAHFLAAADARMRLELAERVAHGFEQLLTYRPEWLAAWSQQQPARLPPAANRADEAWQSALWRRVTAELGTARQHPAERFLQALTQLGPEGARQAGLPDRVDVFALNTLPPVYLQQLQQLSAHVAIHIYALNPCAEFWFDIVDHKRLTRLQAAGRADYHETGNRLLAGWGKQTQALFTLLFEQPEVEEASAQFVDAPPSLLGHLQNSLLHLHELPSGLAVDPADRSVEIHVCHSLTRQLEAVHDRLLGLLVEKPDLQMDQILVGVPDLESAAPLIDAVFGGRGGLPYTITGRPATRSNPVARAVLALVDAAASRLTASEGLALLRDPLIARRFQLNETEVDTLHAALAEAGLHWGLVREGDDPRHSWRDALSRLLLGVARPAGDVALFQNSLPVGRFTGQSAQVLGGLWKFLETMEQLARRVRSEHTAEGWQRVWMSVLENALQVDQDTLEAAREVRTAMAQVTQEMSEGDTDGATTARARFPLAVARVALQAGLDAAPRGGIPGGTVTFAALPSLRSLPYRVVCLLGLDDGVFPGQQRPPEFDLITHDYRPGDRQRRIDDRNLFLDLMLAAREVLHLSYTGRSQKDDSPMPPSVLVAELRDVLTEALGPAASAQRVVYHPLQAFSRRCFAADADARVRSFDGTLATALQQPAESEPPFFAAPLPPLPADETLTLNQLQRFFRHPARALLRDRLGIRLAEPEDEIDDEEPLLPSRESGWALEKRLLNLALQDGVSTAELQAQALAGVELPGGVLGAWAATEQLQRLQDFAAVLRPVLAEATLPPPPNPVHVDVPDAVLEISLKALRPSGLVRYRLVRINALDYVQGWLDHLALCAWRPSGVAPVTRLFGLNAEDAPCVVTFTPVEDAAERLAEWVQAYRVGQQQPLPLPPKTGWTWLDKGPGAAEDVWWDDYQQRGERDPWWSVALRGVLPNGTWLGEEPSAVAWRAGLQDWAERLLGPLQAQLAAQRDGAAPAEGEA